MIMSDKTEQVKPLPCPWCQESTDVMIWHAHNRHFYLCDSCRIRGPVKITAEVALEAWNTRATVKESISTGDREKVRQAIEAVEKIGIDFHGHWYKVTDHKQQKSEE